MVVEFLRVDGMRTERDCRTVLNAVAAIPGVERASLNRTDQTVRVERADTCRLAVILAAVEAAGYRVSVLA